MYQEDYDRIIEYFYKPIYQLDNIDEKQSFHPNTIRYVKCKFLLTQKENSYDLNHHNIHPKQSQPRGVMSGN